MTRYSTNVLVSSASPLQTSLLVLRVDMLSGPERVTFWVNPDLSQPESAATVVGERSWTREVEYVKIIRIRVGGGGRRAMFGHPTKHAVDEIEVSPISPSAAPRIHAAVSTWGLAVSGPAEYAGWTQQTNAAGLGAAGGGGMCRRWRAYRRRIGRRRGCRARRLSGCGRREVGV
ncbi:MAG: hypothetical protein N2652_10815 [Kiritimatiellae bacterium]|nr:hypothetical protein [Kiritimatiellia bacterium]